MPGKRSRRDTIILAVVGTLGGGLFVLLFLFFAGLANVPENADVETLVLDRETRAPVPGCLLTFEIGDTRTDERTDARGRVRQRIGYGYLGWQVLPGARERDPEIRFFVGDPPGFESGETAESWRVQLRFSKPWRAGREVEPRVDVERSLFQERAGRRGRFAYEPLPREAVEHLVNAVVRFDRRPASGDSRSVSYRFLLTVLLDESQIRACRAPGRFETEKGAADLFNSGRHDEALAAYVEAARTWPDAAWAWRGMGHSYGRLRRYAERAEAFRRAASLRPEDAETLRLLADSLVGIDDREAERLYERVVALEPREVDGHVGLARARYRLGRHADALASFATARTLCATCLTEEDRKIETEALRLAARN